MSVVLTSSFGKALMSQARIVVALALREMRVRFGRSQLGYLLICGLLLTFVGLTSERTIRGRVE